MPPTDRPPAVNPVVRRIRRGCAAHADSPAIVGGERTSTYGELRAELDRTVATLREAGVRAGDVAFLHARRVGRLPIAVLSVWELGATAAVVDGALPTTRLHDCEELVRPAWRITMDDPESLAVTRPGDEDTGEPGQDRDTASHILFTSGTTGRPAPVEVERGPLHRTLSWYLRHFGIGSRDRVGLLAGLGHDPMLRDTLVPLMSGGTLVIPPPDVFNPDTLLAFVRCAGLTVIHGTPALLELILAADAAAGGRGLESLRLVVSAGAALTWETVRRLRAATGATIVNAYGATETPQVASCGVIPAWQPVYGDGVPDEATVPVGTGVNGAELLLIGDSAGRGDEIVVRSRNLARGYLSGAGRADRFIADPRGVPGFRAYRTGDLGVRDGDGGIRVVGRLDRQMSINGFRIAPEEIEAAVRRHTGVAQAVARPLTTPTGDLIDLSVVPYRPGAADARSLRAFLRSALPGYAVPSRIRIVTALTLDANHKVSSPPPAVS